MEICNPSSRNRFEIWAYVILIAASGLAAFLAVKNIKISPDSMRFGLISQQILAGNGIRVPIMRLEDNYIPVNGTIPFLDQMPLLPVLFAIMGGLTHQNYMPAQILNLICHAVLAVFTFLLAKNLCNKWIALLTGILVSFSYPLLFNVHHIFSEPLFIALIAAAIYFLISSRNPDSRHFRRNLFIAGVCAGAAIFTRNAGIALIPVFLWEAFIVTKNKRLESKSISTILALTLPVIATATMFIRNYIISGNPRGFNQASPERSYLDAFTGTIETIYQQFPLSKNVFILIILLMVLYMLYLIMNANLRKDFLKYFNAGLDSILVFQICYTALLVITMAKQAWHYELRYASPLVPFLFITIIFIMVFAWERITFRRFLNLSFIGMISSLIIIATGSLYKTYLNLPEFSYRQERAYSILNSCSYKWIRENYEKDTIIATNRPFHLSFFGGYSTIALPHKRFDQTINIPDDMESLLTSRMSKVGSQVLVLFEEAEESYDGKYIAKLFNDRRTDKKFILAHECSDGVIYNLRQ
jgi:hypothetical protein